MIDLILEWGLKLALVAGAWALFSILVSAAWSVFRDAWGDTE